jgi:hypothetical protein
MKKKGLKRRKKAVLGYAPKDYRKTFKIPIEFIILQSKFFLAYKGQIGR